MFVSSGAGSLNLKKMSKERKSKPPFHRLPACCSCCFAWPPGPSRRALRSKGLDGLGEVGALLHQGIRGGSQGQSLESPRTLESLAESAGFMGFPSVVLGPMFAKVRRKSQEVAIREEHIVLHSRANQDMLA